MRCLKGSCLILSMAIGYCSQAFAFTCFLTLVKDSCWTDYDVTLDVINPATDKVVVSATAAKGQSWNRIEFACQPADTYRYDATFSPVIWEQEKGKHYAGMRTWSLPNEIKKGDTAWNITVCYPEQFASVPLPPTAKGNCVCHMHQVPPVVPPKS